MGAQAGAVHPVLGDTAHAVLDVEVVLLGHGQGRVDAQLHEALGESRGLLFPPVRGRLGVHILHPDVVIGSRCVLQHRGVRAQGSGQGRGGGPLRGVAGRGRCAPLIQGAGFVVVHLGLGHHHVHVVQVGRGTGLGAEHRQFVGGRVVAVQGDDLHPAVVQAVGWPEVAVVDQHRRPFQGIQDHLGLGASFGRGMELARGQTMGVMVGGVVVHAVCSHAHAGHQLVQHILGHFAVLEDGLDGAGLDGVGQPLVLHHAGHRGAHHHFLLAAEQSHVIGLS